MRLIFMGDMHIEKHDLDEGARIMTWARGIAETENACLALPGDLYNDFGSARVEVVEFWAQHILGAIVWEGNHDQNAEGDSSALAAHAQTAAALIRNSDPDQWEKNVLASVDRPDHRIGFVPFIRDNEKFTRLCMKLYENGVRLIFCHQEFQGCKYDNGYYSPHGCPLEVFPADLKFISGHIHTMQEFGNVWYPGTSRHLTRSDIGKQKGVWLIDTLTGERKFFATPESVSEPFRQFTITETTPLPSGFRIADDRVYVDVRGSKTFIDQVLGTIPAGVKVRTFPDHEEVVSDVRESDGIPTAFQVYAEKYFNSNATAPELVPQILARVHQLVPSLQSGVK